MRRLRENARTLRDAVAAHVWWLRAELAARPGDRARVRPVDPRTIVLLAWSFPPIVSGGTYRPLAVARYGAALGWNVLVIASEPWAPRTAAGLYLLSTVPDAVRVSRVPWSAQTTVGWIPRIDSSFLAALAIFDKARAALDGVRPAAVLASGPPFHTFVAGYYLSKTLGSPLLLDYRDEWTECPFDFVETGAADRQWERRCLSAADAVVFTTRSQLDHQLRVFPSLAPERCVLIPNGWEPANVPADHPVTTAPRRDGEPHRFVLSFVGTLGSWTAPDRFLSTLSEVLRTRPELRSVLRVRFVGAKTPEALARLTSFPDRELLEIAETVPAPAAGELLRSSDALLLLNSDQLARYIPGKLYEYIAARRPVLVFGEGGEIGALVRELDAGVVVPSGDPAALEGALDALAAGKVRHGSSPAIESWLSAHTRARMAEDFFALVDSAGRRATLR